MEIVSGEREGERKRAREAGERERESEKRGYTGRVREKERLAFFLFSLLSSLLFFFRSARASCS